MVIKLLIIHYKKMNNCLFRWLNEDKMGIELFKE